MKLIIIILFTSITFAQSSIVASGTNTYTIGETFPIMQQLDTIAEEVSLSVPKYEIEQPKPIVKKKLTWWQRLLKAIFG